MNNLFKKLLFIPLYIIPSIITADCGSATKATPYFNLRSTSWNVVRDMVGWEDQINLCNQDCWYGAAALTVEYDQTLRPNRIARALFNDDVTSQASCPSNTKADCAAVLNISGSQVTNRGANDWLADYFGLPTLFQSKISFCPRIENFTADFSWYCGLDRCSQGLYFRLDAPFTRTRWNLNANEKVITLPAGTLLSYPAGYFTSQSINADDLFTSALDFFHGNNLILPSDTINNITVIFDPLQASLWAPCNASCTQLTQLAAFIGVLGWNFVCCDDYHFGLNLRAAAPTGNRPCGRLLFEPVVGNGHHWEFGAGVSAHANIWECDTRSVNLYLEGNITHLFSACQTRTFDLCNKPNSRYMLAERLIPQTNGLGGTVAEGDTTVDDVTFSTYQFANEFAPVANLTLTPVRVTIAAQGDIALKLELQTGCGFVWDIGYNLWGRTAEKIKRSCCNSDNDNLVSGQFWALKGNAHVYGFTSGIPVALAATQNCADIHTGTNTESIGANILNPGIDNHEFAVVVTGSTVLPLHPNNFLTNQTATSIQPILLTKDLVDLAGTTSFSNKLFTHLTYEWECFESCMPFLGAGASIELGANDLCKAPLQGDTCTKPCGVNTCEDSCSTHAVSVSQWGVWVKGGVSY
jgi:hypothetical protein